jgi:hypothetical protein
LVGLLTPVVKGWCTDNALHIASDGVQVHGGMGYIEETGAAQYMRDARITTIYEGTTGIQANDLIGRKLARDDARTMTTLIKRIDGDARRLIDSNDATLAQIGHALYAAVRTFDACTNWLIAQSAEDAVRCAAGAVPFLRLSGTVISGWLMARMAESAVTQLAAANGDREFLSAKLVTARHFATHTLVLAPALRDVVIAGADSTLALSDEQL